MTFPVRTAIADAVASAVASATQDATGAIQRIFIPLNGVDEYFTIQNPVVATGDFSYSFEFETTNSINRLGVFGHISAQFNFFRMRADSTFEMRTSTETTLVFNTPASILQDGKLNNGILSRTSGMLSLVVNSEDLGSIADSGTFTTSVLFVSANATELINFFDGITANVDLGGGNAWQLNRPLPATTEQSSSGTNLLTYVGAPTTELFTFIDGRWVGSNERVVNGTFTVNVAGWLKVFSSTTIESVNGQLRAAANGTNQGEARQEVPIVIGETYTVSVDSRAGETNARWGLGTSVGQEQIFSNTETSTTFVTATTIFTATVDKLYIRLRTLSAIDDDDCFFDNVIVKRVIQIA